MPPNVQFREGGRTENLGVALGQRLLVEQTANMLGSTSPSHLEAHAGFFKLSMKGKFDVYLLLDFGKKLIFIL